MMFKTHLALGILAGVLAIKYLQPESSLLFGITVSLASVIPDIDISKSTVGKSFWPVSSLVGFFFGHRGFVHTVFPPIMVMMTAFALGYSQFGEAFIIGWLVHLTADMATVQGIAPFFPITKARTRGFIRTGGLIEHIVLFTAIIAILMVF